MSDFYTLNLGRDLSVVRAQTSRSAKVARAAELSCISMAQLTAHGRGTIKVAHKRWRVMWLLQQLGWSYAEIGRQLNRDHASVMYGIRKFEEAIPQTAMAAE